jgi:hypothetical protein
VRTYATSVCALTLLVYAALTLAAEYARLQQVYEALSY